MKKLLTRLILWALPLDWHELHGEVAALMKERATLRDRIEHCEASITQLAKDTFKRTGQLADSIAACSKEIEDLRAKLAAQPEAQPTVRRAGNYGEFRAAAEAPVKKRR